MDLGKFTARFRGANKSRAHNARDAAAILSLLMLSRAQKCAQIYGDKRTPTQTKISKQQLFRGLIFESDQLEGSQRDGNLYENFLAQNQDYTVTRHIMFPKTTEKNCIQSKNCSNLK